jgi:hypothetical protein
MISIKKTFNCDVEDFSQHSTITTEHLKANANTYKEYLAYVEAKFYEEFFTYYETLYADFFQDEFDTFKLLEAIRQKNEEQIQMYHTDTHTRQIWKSK